MERNIFERASRQNLCYEGYKGLISVNDLWSLPLKGRGVTLDKIWTDLYTSTKDDNIVSPAMKTNRKDSTDKLRFDIVDHIIRIRMDEADVAEKANEIKQKKARVLEIMHSQEDAELVEMAKTDPEGLKKLYESM